MKELEVINEYPPNIKEIQKTFGDIVLESNVIFTYGDKLFNPKNIYIDTHLFVHEKVHQLQQKETGIDLWWETYLKNPEFRLKQELEAYACQYKYIKEHYNNKILKRFSSYVGQELSSSLYGNMISSSKVETKIRLWTK